MTSEIDLDHSWRALVTDDVGPRLAVLWGKSKDKGGGKVNLLLQHLFDTMAVAELVWDEFLSEGFRRRIAAVAGGPEAGRRLYVWLCGLHDVGKATPAFQAIVPELAQRVVAAGLTWSRDEARGQHWNHAQASALVLIDTLGQEWPLAVDQIAWIWPMVDGHHGIYRALEDVTFHPRYHRRRSALQGDEAWGTLQRLLVDIVTLVAGYRDLASAQPAGKPSRADQLAMSGYVTMADWVASNDKVGEGIDRWQDVSFATARGRAAKAWHALQLRGGWRSDLLQSVKTFSDRFGRAPRPLQVSAVEAARAMGAPGLMLIEAPTGEGKTEACLAAAEVLAARFGADGIYVAMPSQATSDAMYDRVLSWLQSFGSPLPLALLHGGHRHNKSAGYGALASLESPIGDGGSAKEEPGDDPYGVFEDPPSFQGVCVDGSPAADDAGRPAQWFFGRRRGLLTANAVGTIDQALFAGTRTKYVSVRYAGLAGKIVIFDEVHAADIYMAEFLGEVLSWLGNGHVPVILASATLSPGARRTLIDSYVEGVTLAAAIDGTVITTPTDAGQVLSTTGYPTVLTVCAKPDLQYLNKSVTPWRAPKRTRITICEEEATADPGPVVTLLRERLIQGGCALVVRNTVERAQATWRELLRHFGDDVVLLHSRFISDIRDTKTRRLLRQLGPDGSVRPKRLVVVATQVAEQSFDVDADILVTDAAPIDLLLQRAGRAHRHDRPQDRRPQPVRQPEVVVSGLYVADGRPWFPPGSEAIYGRHHLLRSAALTLQAAGSDGWLLPEDVPQLVAAAYEGHLVWPPGWAEDDNDAMSAWTKKADAHGDRAQVYLLRPRDLKWDTTLQGLHTAGSRSEDAEDRVKVRDGDIGEEVVVVLRRDGYWETIGGVRLGTNGERGALAPERVLGASLRLPDLGEPFTSAARGLTPLDGWRGDPWLEESRALRLDEMLHVELGRRHLTYGQDSGLVIGPSR